MLTKSQECSSKALEGKIEARIDYTFSTHNNLIELSKAIGENSLNFEEMCYKMATISDMLKNFILRKQKDRKSLLDCIYRFKVACNLLALHVDSLMHLLKWISS